MKGPHMVVIGLYRCKGATQKRGPHTGKGAREGEWAHIGEL